MFRTYAFFFAYTDNTDLAILLNKDIFEQDPLSPRLGPTPRAKIRGAWYYSSFVPCCAARLFQAHLQSHFARYTSTMLWPRNGVHPLSFSNSFSQNAGVQG